MKKTLSIINNEKGALLPIIAMILCLITIIGISATTRTTTECQIVRNESVYKDNFISAEAATNECIMRIEESSSDNLKAWTYAWLFESSDFKSTGPGIDDPPGDWDATNSGQSLDTNIRYIAVDEGVDINSSLDTSGTRLHAFTIYGCAWKDRAMSRIQVGYKKRY